MKKFLLIAVLTLLTLPLGANTSLEQERLVQIAKELELVRRLVEQTSEEIPNREQQKIRFQYDLLIRQIQSLEYGVSQHIDLQNRSPREHWDLGVITEEENKVFQ